MKKIKNKSQKKFIEITYQILNNKEIQDIITWDETGTKILILDRQLLQSNVLPKYFKHSNYQSFQRQLNLYGFTSSKDQNGILNYYNKNFTKQVVQQNFIQKKVNTIQLDQNEFIFYKQEQIKLREQVLCLQIDQDKVKQQLISSVKQQLEIQNNIQKLLLAALKNKLQQDYVSQYLIDIMKKLVEEMKPGIPERDLLQHIFGLAFNEQIQQQDNKIDIEEILNSKQLYFSPQSFIDIDIYSYQSNDIFQI